MNLLRKLFDKIPNQIKNKYFITIFLFSIWIIFFDDYNIIKQQKLKQRNLELENLKKDLKEKISNDSTLEYNLKNDKETQIRVAREKYHMTKPNEQVFILEKKESE